MIQEAANPQQKGKPQLQVGARIFRVNDRVIHHRNNYDLGVFNGDIGVIRAIDNEELTCTVDCWYSGIYNLLCQKFGLFDNIEN
jgi:exodeoxyribonuclease V alpha subunit